MYYVFLTSQVATETQEVAPQVPPSSIIGIGGIIATILIGIITCIVTWKVTMQSIKQLKMSYNIQIFPILSNTVTKNSEINLDKLKIQYKDKVLSNPCLLTLEIVNAGNVAISEPPIRIKSNENIEIIPGYFEDVPSGYEELWQFSKTEHNSCNICLKHINQKQIVKARFFLDNLPHQKIIFECPMENVYIQEVAYNNTILHKNTNAFFKSNMALIAVTILLFISMETWAYFINEFIWATEIHLQTAPVVAFIMSVLLLTIVMNAYGIPKVDNYITLHSKQAVFIKLGLVVISLILLALIICDYIIIRYIPQVITAIIVIIFLSLFLHFLIISKKQA